MKQAVGGVQAFCALAAGAEEMVRLLGSTYGPMGRRIVLGKPGQGPVMLSSGGQLAQDLAPENAGAGLILDVVQKVSSGVGDGTTAAAVMAGEMLRRTAALLSAGVEAKALCQELERLTALAEAEIRRQARPVSSPREAAEWMAGRDEELSALVVRAFEAVTAEGIVTVREAKRRESSVTVYESAEIDQGYCSPAMITDVKHSRTVLEDAAILLTDQVLSVAEQVVPAMNLAKRAGRPLFVMAQDVTGEALATMNLNNQRGKLRSLAVKATAYGQRRREILEDIAALTGAQVLTEELGLDPARVEAAQLGYARQVTAEAAHTYLAGGAGTKEAIRRRAEQLRGEMRATPYEVDRVNLRNRIARLEGGVATIYVGAPTHAEEQVRRMETTKSVAAVRAALREGIVAGGGVCLLQAAGSLPPPAGAGGAEERSARSVLTAALRAPLCRMAENAGEPAQRILSRLEHAPAGYGYDFVGRRYGNMLELGIADCAAAAALGLRAACSAVSTALRTGAVLL